MPERQASGDKLLMEGFGERLRVLRKAYAERFGAKHHTKALWARRLWVSPAMYGRWEGGHHLPKFVDLLRVSLLFRVDPNYLVAGVLSEHLTDWLRVCLKAAIPELMDAAGYFQDQNELFERASLGPSDASGAASATRAISGSTNPENDTSGTSSNRDRRSRDGVGDGKQLTKKSPRASRQGRKGNPLPSVPKKPRRDTLARHN